METSGNELGTDFDEKSPACYPPGLPVNRREFLRLAAAGGVALGATSSLWSAETKGEMSYRTLGRTGERVSAIGLGGYHIGSLKEEQDGIRIIRSALDRGITFLDNSWDYNE